MATEAPGPIGAAAPKSPYRGCRPQGPGHPEDDPYVSLPAVQSIRKRFHFVCYVIALEVVPGVLSKGLKGPRGPLNGTRGPFNL